MSASWGRPGWARVGIAHRTVGMNGSSTTSLPRATGAAHPVVLDEAVAVDVEQRRRAEPADVPLAVGVQARRRPAGWRW